MKKYLLIAGVVASGALMVGCGAGKSNPGYAYMPDMQYSVAYETYAPTDYLKEQGISFNGLPVSGAIARGDDFSFTLKHDSTGLAQSAFLKNPLDSAGAVVDMVEAERLYQINCGICHGQKLDGNGPLYKDGEGPYIAAPKNFMADDMKALPVGTMYYSITYGKGQMGSYASQLTPKQRWEVIAFIRKKQGVSAGTSATAPKADSTAAAKK